MLSGCAPEAQVGPKLQREHSEPEHAAKCAVDVSMKHFAVAACKATACLGRAPQASCNNEEPPKRISAVNLKPARALRA